MQGESALHASRLEQDMSNQDEQEFLSPDPEALSAEPSIEEERLTTSASKVLKEHHDVLMSRPGVVMVGETIDVLGRPAIMIGVKTAKGLSKLPREIDGVPVVTQVIGEVDAL